MPQTGEPSAPVTIYYDGDCPLCSDYVRHLRLKEAVGAPRLVDLREAHEARDTLEAAGFDVDKGMVAEIAGRRYGGSDALHALALLTTPNGAFNRVTAALFSSPMAARLSYPLLRAGRNSLLTVLGRKPIRADDDGWQALFTVFSLTFGLFAVFHFFSYAFVYTAFEIYPTTWIILALGVWLLLFPGSTRAFALLIPVMMVDGWLHAPMASNHTILKNFFLLGLGGAAAWHLLKGSRWSEFFRDAVPVGRVLLLVMYVFGVFHKINTGFLDPASSCAVVLWRGMPWPIGALDHPVLHYMAIYGTFVVEAVIVMMLISSRFRSWGIVAGIGFHGFLALSGFANYQAFSTLTIALHVLFLSPDQAREIVRGRHWRVLTTRLTSWPGRIVLGISLLLVAVFSLVQAHTMVTFVWLIMTLLLFMAILLPGRTERLPSDAPVSAPGRLLWSRLGWLNVLGLLFFLNCAAPYFGLKTAQTMNMFSNLRLEGGINNHLVMGWAPAPFPYLDDVVEVRAASGDRYLEHAAGSEYRLVYYDLLHRLERSPDATVTFVRDGGLYEDQSALSLADDRAGILHPAWFRKWFHFRMVDVEGPPACF